MLEFYDEGLADTPTSTDPKNAKAEVNCSIIF